MEAVEEEKIMKKEDRAYEKAKTSEEEEDKYRVKRTIKTARKMRKFQVQNRSR